MKKITFIFFGLTILALVGMMGMPFLLCRSSNGDFPPVTTAIRHIQTAEMQYKEKYQTYATIEELIKTGFIYKSYIDSWKDGNYTFKCWASKDKFTLIAIPDEPDSMSTYKISETNILEIMPASRSVFEPYDSW